MKFLLITALSLAATCSAGIIFDSVDVAAQFPSMGTVFLDGGIKTVDGTVEYPTGTFTGYSAFISIQLTDTQFIMTFNGSGGNFTPAAFNGFEVAFLTGTITGAVADGTSAFNPVISIVGNNLFLNYQGIDALNGQASIIDLTGTSSSSVPEPAGIAILGSGLAALALLRKRILR